MPNEMTSVEVRSKLAEALRLDLVGPVNGFGDRDEVLSQAPSRWYLTGFLVPIGAKPANRSDETADDDLDEAPEPGADDDVSTDRAAAKQRYFPSSIGLSVIVPVETEKLKVSVEWGDYHRKSGSPEEWERTQRSEIVEISLEKATDKPLEKKVPNSSGLYVAYLSRPVGLLATEASLSKDARTVSVFVVNRRDEAPDEKRDEAFAFQVQLEVTGDTEFLRRPDLRSMASDDWDERVADLQYRDEGEYSVGHNISTQAVRTDGSCCRLVHTCWIPEAQVEKVEAENISGVELSMDALANLKDGAEAKAKLDLLVTSYRSWIDKQSKSVPATPTKRKETAHELARRASDAASRIQAGIDLLGEKDVLEAFRLANYCMAEAARRRMGVMKGKDPAEVRPAWRLFQLAFLLMNLKGVVDPEHYDRSLVDLLFFPTGGGKTEAYLGLTAFTLVLRRLRNPGITSAGLTVLMRYTLRLLTLDQLGRAATLICALELQRQKDVEKLGEWPFEIGLWVGRAATPNRMGRKGVNDPHSARSRTIRFAGDDRKPAPIPLEDCPWCGTKFTRSSFRLIPNPDTPEDLRVSCVNRECDFSRGTSLPILAVDEPIYRRLPCFLIATVDKFAALPWTGEVGGFFGRVERYDKDGFYGPCDSVRGRNLPIPRLLPPELIIQDELHLISGPLGTMVGLYETALDELSAIDKDGKSIRPKIVASTATVRRAETQIRALFNRSSVDIFPPPGPDRRDSFFAKTYSPSERNARLYLGVAAQGRSPKVTMLRVYLALLGAGQKWHGKLKGRGRSITAADPYLTLVGYFNSLRELGGSRRLIEDEVRNRLAGYGDRKRVGETEGLFANRTIDYEPVELTSRVDTARVSESKRRLELNFSDEKCVDVAIATNMISVGLDITRLGLMVVFGQPKSSAEYIQATSRVGRDVNRPGFVVTIFNVHKPRDRSHYERFASYHETFYRSVEATSVTPFSPRALDKGLAATLVGLARQGHRPMTPATGANQILNERAKLDFVMKAIVERAYGHTRDLEPDELEALRQKVRNRCVDLMESWAKEAQEYQQTGTVLQYAQEAGGARPLLYDFLSPELKNLPPYNRKMKFRANRSLRDVEASVNVWVKTLDNLDLEVDAQ
jgi:Helicase conserved C-terminal domain